jgi:hypothetical protein
VFHVSNILDDIKKTLSLAPDYTAFDQEIIIFINTALSTLNQIGIGPDAGLMIADNTTTWDAFIGSDANYNNVKSYIYLRARMLFDPPNNSFVINAMTKQIEELEWRLNVKREGVSWTDPNPSPPVPSDETCWWES